MALYLASGLAPTIMVLRLAVANKTDTAASAPNISTYLHGVDFDTSINSNTLAIGTEHVDMMLRPQDHTGLNQ
ncbi:hypothetical protein JR316_0007603 [Psilocybe cubensis]|nr:hypothetical protein JR316_0007603 [Psilocybe cubensis]KAH9479029.1 hypothetical protein JR316_0007603 [Psilocybe cubensis]